MTLNEFLSKAGDLFKSNNASAELSAVQTEVAQLKTNVETLSTQNGELSQKLEASEKQNAELKSAAEKAEADHKAALESKQKEVTELAAAKAAIIAASAGAPPVHASIGRNEPQTLTEKCRAANAAKVSQ